MLFITSIIDGSVVLLTMSLLYKLRKNYFLPGICALVLAGILVYLMKNYFEVLRPVHHIQNEAVTVMGRSLTTYSFPSGHAAAAMVFSVYLKGGSKHFLLYLSIGILGGMSRIFVGVHFPSDVWAGAWLGYWTAASVFYLFANSKLLAKIQNIKLNRYLPFFAGFSSILIYIFFHTSKNEEIDIVLEPLLVLSGITLVVFLWQEIKNSSS